MVSSGGLSRLPRSRHQGTLGTLLGPSPERRLYLFSDAPQILTVWSSLPLARDLASGLHVTAFTSLKAFKSGRRGCRKTIVLKSSGNGCEKFTRSARAGSTRTDPCWCSRSWSSCLRFHWLLYRRGWMQQRGPCVCDAMSQHKKQLRQGKTLDEEKKISLIWVPGQRRHARASRRLPYLDGFVHASTGHFLTICTEANTQDFPVKCSIVSIHHTFENKKQ